MLNRISDFTQNRRMRCYLHILWFWMLIPVLPASERPVQEELYLQLGKLEITLSAGETTTFEALAEACFESQIAARHKIKTKSQLPQNLHKIHMLIAWFSNPQSMQNEPLFHLSENTNQLLRLPPQTHWISFLELKEYLQTLRLVGRTPLEWGTLDNETIQHSRELVDHYRIITRIASTFRLEDTNSNFEATYLNWIQVNKRHLESFQNAIEGSEGTPSAQTEAFGNTYTDLQNTIKDLEPLKVIPVKIQNGETEWQTIQEQLLVALDQFFIPKGILDWAQLLDALKAENWELARTHLQRIQSRQTTSMDSVDPTSFLSKTKDLLFRILFWLCWAMGIAMGYLYIKGIRRALPVSLIFLLIACAFKTYDIKATLPVNDSLFAAALLAGTLIASTIGALSYPQRKIASTYLFIAIISSLLLPRSFQSVFQTNSLALLIYSELVAGMVLATTHLSFFTYCWISKKKDHESKRFRTIDGILYPTCTIIGCLLCIDIWIHLYSPAATTTTKAMLSSRILVWLLLGFQLIHYYMIRWMNLSTITHLLTTSISISFLWLLILLNTTFGDESFSLPIVSFLVFITIAFPFAKPIMRKLGHVFSRSQ